MLSSYRALSAGLVLAFGLFSSTVQAQIPVQIINNAPGVETAAVDVYVDGGKVLENLAFKEASVFIDGTGTPQIIVGPTSTIVFADSMSTDASSPLVSRTLTLGELTGFGLIELLGLVTPITNPDGRNTSLSVLVFNGYQPAATAPDSVRLMAVHASPDLGTVDLLVHLPNSALPATPIFTGLAYGDAQDYVILPADSTQLYLMETGTTNILKSWSADFRLVAGAGVVGNAGDFASNLTLFGAVATEDPANPGRAVVFELNEVPATDVGGITPPRATTILRQNFPNPFNPSTTIPLLLDESLALRLSVYDSRGRLVRVLIDGELGPGPHLVPFSGEGLASGSYHYELRTPRGTESRTMMLVK